MRRELASLFLWGLTFILPSVALGLLGVAWLIEHDRWLLFGLVSAVVIAVLIIASRWLALTGRREAQPPPEVTWPDAGNRAWRDVDRLAARVEANPPAFGDTTAYQNLFLEVLDTVGKHFHPESEHPHLELTVSQILEISERSLRDLRREVVDVSSLVKNLKLRQILWARDAMTYLPAAQLVGRWAYLAYRFRRLFVNPAAAIAYEVLRQADKQHPQVASQQAAKLGAGFFVRQVGQYAIQAFSDQASLDTTQLHRVAEDAPLRVLLLGPINAGKSSLINALFGQERSRVDSLPCPGILAEHVLERDGLPKAVVLDSDGFGGAGDEAARRELFRAIESIDLVIAVTSAAQADRKLECETLEAIKRHFAKSTKQACPPILVAATHVDQLRPAKEWNPPYDFVEGESTKELSVRSAVGAISQDFQSPPEWVVPICLAPGAEYNVDEGLIPAMGAVLPEADRAKFLRLVQLHRTEEEKDRIAKRLDLALKIVARVVGVPTNR